MHDVKRNKMFCGRSVAKRPHTYKSCLVIGYDGCNDRLPDGCILTYVIVEVMLYPPLFCRVLVDGSLPRDPEVVGDARLSLGGHDFSDKSTKRQNLKTKMVIVLSSVFFLRVLAHLT